QRGADETAILKIGLQRIVLRLVDEHAREAAPHEIGEVERAPLAKLLGRRALHVRGDAVRIRERAERRRSDDLDLLDRLACRLRQDPLPNQRPKGANRMVRDAHLSLPARNVVPAYNEKTSLEWSRKSNREIDRCRPGEREKKIGSGGGTFGRGADCPGEGRLGERAAGGRSSAARDDADYCVC